MRSSDFEFKQIKSEFKEKYFKLPFHDAKICNTLNHLTLILIASSFSLLVALITSIIIKQETYITTYSLLYVFLSLFTLFIFLTIERRNLFSIVLSIWKSLYDIELLNKGETFKFVGNVLMTTNKILTKNEKIYKSIFIA